MENAVKQPEQEEMRMIVGEVHIIVDPSNGQVKVSAPANKIVALGLLELAKAIVINQPARTTIPVAPADLLNKLGGRPQ